MHFYSVDSSKPAIIELKKLINLLLIEPLIESLKDISSQVVLYGSCAQGADTSKSDLDLFIVSSNRERVAEVINNFSFQQGFEDIHIQRSGRIRYTMALTTSMMLSPNLLKCT